MTEQFLQHEAIKVDEEGRVHILCEDLAQVRVTAVHVGGRENKKKKKEEEKTKGRRRRRRNR